MDFIEMMRRIEFSASQLDEDQRKALQRGDTKAIIEQLGLHFTESQARYLRQLTPEAIVAQLLYVTWLELGYKKVSLETIERGVKESNVFPSELK